jgi:hypothetical protein
MKRITGKTDSTFRKAVTSLTASAIMVGLACGSALAGDPAKSVKNLPVHQRPAGGGGGSSLAEQATNPVSNLMQIQLQNSYNWDNYNSSGASNTFIVQPVIPISLPWKAVPLWISRTTLPYIRTPGFPVVGHEHGFGDITMNNFFTLNLGLKGQTIGIGPTFVFPTAGDNEFTGNGKWQAGPTFLYINHATKTQFGILAYQLWSFASTSSGKDRPGVSKIALQPFVNQHLDKGWYVGSPDAPQFYDWKTDKWQLNLGGQVGRVFKIGKQPVKMFGEILHNPVDNGGPTAKWTAKFGLTFLFPE